MKQFALYGILIVLLLSSLVSAQSITDISFHVGEHPLEYVRLQHPQTVRMDVVVQSQEPLNSLQADLRVLNPNPNYQQTYQAVEFPCQGNVSVGFTCTKNDLYIIPSQQQINFSFQTPSENKLLNYTYTFQLDATTPYVQKVISDNCNQEECFLKQHEKNIITIQLEDEQGTFHQKKVFYTLDGGSLKRVDSCQGTACNDTLIPSCTPGERVYLEMGNQGVFQTQDDAGNAIQETYKTSFRCDANEPQLQDQGITVSSQEEFYPRPLQGDTITFWATVLEDASGVQARINTSQLTGENQLLSTQCSPVSTQLYNCSWTISEVLPGDAQLSIELQDGVGKTATYQSDSIHVDKTQTPDSSVETTPKIFNDITAQPSAPNGYNRVLIGLSLDNGLSYPMSATFDMQKQFQGNVQALSTTIDPYTCVYETPEGEQFSASSIFDISIADPFADYTQTNRVNFEFKGSGATAINDINSDFTLRCNVSTVVRVNNEKVYTQPTQFGLEIPIEFRNSALGDQTPGTKYVKAIQQKEEQINNGLYKTIGFLDSVAKIATEICTVEGVLQQLGYDGALMQIAGAGLSMAGLQVGDNLKMSGQQLIGMYEQVAPDEQHLSAKEETKQQAKKQANKKKINEFFEDACEFVKCNIPQRMKDYDRKEKESWYYKPDQAFFPQYQQAQSQQSIQSGVDIINKQQDSSSIGASSVMKGIQEDLGEEILGNINYPNPKDSVIAAVQTKCYPAMIYHLNQLRELQCKELTCLKTMGRVGGDIAVCQRLKAQFVCEKVVGELFELPYVRQVKNIMDNTNAFIQLIIPNTIKLVAENTLCKNVLDPAQHSSNPPGNIAIIACRLPKAVGQAMNYQQKNTDVGMNFTYPLEAGVCDFALCNEEDPQDCKGYESFTKKFTGMDLPSSIIPSASGDEWDAGSTPKEIIALLEEYRTGDPETKDALKQQLLAYSFIEETDLQSNQAMNALKDRMGEVLIEDAQIHPGENLEFTLTQWGAFGKAYTQERSFRESMILNASSWGNKTEIQEYINYLFGDFYEQKLLYELQESFSYFKTVESFKSTLLNQRKKPFSMSTLNNGFSSTSLLLGGGSGLSTSFQLNLNNVESSNGNEYDDPLQKRKELRAKLDNDVACQIDEVFDEVDWSGRYVQNDNNPYDCSYDGKHLVQAVVEKYEQADLLVLLINDRLERLKELQKNLPNTGSSQQAQQKKENLLEEAITALEEEKNYFVSSLKKGTYQLLVGDEIKNLTANDIKKLQYGQNDETLTQEQKDIMHENGVKYVPENENYVDMEKLEELYLAKRNYARAQERLATLGNYADQAAAFAAENGWLDFLGLRHYPRDSVLGSVSETADRFLNSENYEQGICSPLVMKNTIETSQQGTVIQCEGEYCQPVLTLAAEKIPFNETHYLYGINYYLGGVTFPEGVDEQKQDIAYTLAFKQTAQHGGKLSELFTKYQTISYDDPIHDFSHGFTSKTNYDQICIEFKQRFPPRELTGVQRAGDGFEYCRDIVQASQGESAWDTGRPPRADEAQANVGSTQSTLPFSMNTDI